MAIIGKIRSKSGLLVGFIFVALALFVLSDFLGGKGGGGGQNPSEMVAGEVFGHEINLLEYDQEVQSNIEIAKQNQGDRYTDDMADRIREDVWNQRVNDIIFEKELKGFHNEVIPAELNDLLFGENISDVVSNNQMFRNPFGQFSLDSAKLWRQRAEQNPNVKQWWVESIEKPVKQNRKIIKYFNLITKGMYVTKAEAERDNVDKTRKYKIRYVAQQFKDIADSTLKVSDEEIREYYNKNKHRKKFEAFGSRSFSFVEFLLVPTAADVEYAKNQAESLYDRFKNAKDDSSFVMTYSETKNFNEGFSAPGAFPESVDSLIQKADSGSIIGPFLDGDYWKVVKVRAVKMEPEARVRHILIGKEVRDPMTGAVLKTRTKEEIQKRADSIYNVIKKNNNFDEMVALTDDGGSKNTKGVYEWFPKGRMVKPFDDASFNGKLNVLTKVETDFGIHLVEPLGRREAKRIKSAMVDVKVRPMKETDMEVRSKAVDFLSKIKESSQFQQVAQSLKLNVQSKEIAYNQGTIDGSQGSRQLAGWVHRANENDISENPILLKGNEQMAMRMPGAQYDRWVVVKLDNIKKKGIPEFEDVKDMMKLEVLRAKKGDIQAKQMQGAKSLEELATRLKTTVHETELTFSSISFPDLPESGTEYRVIGSIFSMKKPGDMSVALKGENGVYVVMLTNITEATPLPNVEESRKNLTNALRGNAQGGAYQALRELAKIEDTRPIN